MIPGAGRSPGGGNGNPLQYYCLKNPMDRGAWPATVHGVAKSQTWLGTHVPCTFLWTEGWFRKEKCFGKLLTVQTVSFTPRSAFPLKGHRKIELPKCKVFVTVPESNIYTLQLFWRENKNVWAVKRGWTKHLPPQLSLESNAVQVNLSKPQDDHPSPLTDSALCDYHGNSSHSFLTIPDTTHQSFKIKSRLKMV